MLVGALADAGAGQNTIAEAVAALAIGATVSFEKVQRRGIGGSRWLAVPSKTRRVPLLSFPGEQFSQMRHGLRRHIV
jgi:uncharacterized protein (DUF111 family)